MSFVVDHEDENSKQIAVLVTCVAVLSAAVVFQVPFTPPRVLIWIRTGRPVLSLLLPLLCIVWRLVSPTNTPSVLSIILQVLQEMRGSMDRFWIILEDLLGLMLCQSVCRVVYCLYQFSYREWYTIIVNGSFEWLQHNIPYVSSSMDELGQKLMQDIERDVLKKDPKRTIVTKLPLKGLAHADLLEQLTVSSQRESLPWKEGRLSGTIYPSRQDEAHSQFLNQVYSLYSWSNPLHAGVWPRANQCEAEVIRMTASMLHGDTVVGSMTSGGTESIVLAIRAHLQFYGRHMSHPELICGTTAHAAVDKACEMFGIRKVMVDCPGPHYTLTAAKARPYITSNTILIYASAPSYPQGVIDPIEELSDVALQYQVGLHVDACLGGFVLPFCDEIPKFDFRCAGVTSMSADTHKFGYACKGSSVVLYRHAELLHSQYFSYSKWTGGMYCTPTIAGSRAGGLVVTAWAALMAIGESGYRERVKVLVEAARSIASGIEQDIDGLKVLGEQKPTMVVCFGAAPLSDLDIYRVGHYMSKRGWSLNDLQSPACIHICVTQSVAPQAQRFLEDLKQSVEEVRKEGKRGTEGTVGIYGMTGSIPAGPVNHLLKVFTDLTLSP